MGIARFFLRCSFPVHNDSNKYLWVKTRRDSDPLIHCQSLFVYAFELTYEAPDSHIIIMSSAIC